MSLDVYLIIKDTVVNKPGSGIFIRENGETKEISRAEWNEKFPNYEPIIFASDDEDDWVYNANITHNLGEMASEAGIYQYLWRPEELEITKAGQLIEPLEKGLQRLKDDPKYFQQFNPENGWGDYDGLVRFVEKYLEACKEYPQTEIEVSR